jgi:hypothetical protein
VVRVFITYLQKCSDSILVDIRNQQTRTTLAPSFGDVEEA